MSDIILLIAALSIPFMLGIAAGVEVVKRRPKSTNEKFGELIKSRMATVYTQGQWIIRGSGFEVSNTLDFDMPHGRKIQVIVREIA